MSRAWFGVVGAVGAAPLGVALSRAVDGDWSLMPFGVAGLAVLCLAGYLYQSMWFVRWRLNRPERKAVRQMRREDRRAADR